MPTLFDAEIHRQLRRNWNEVAMSSVPPIQDMPPEGGYLKINFKRVPPKQMFTGIFHYRVFINFLSYTGYSVSIQTWSGS